jgi:hypothetical protein
MPSSKLSSSRNLEVKEALKNSSLASLKKRGRPEASDKVRQDQKSGKCSNVRFNDHEKPTTTSYNYRVFHQTNCEMMTVCVQL